MDDLGEFESWHEDLMAWECFQDELDSTTFLPHPICN